MPIVMRVEHGGSRVALLCDHCGREIGDARDGIALWASGGGDGGAARRVAFTHGACRQPFGAAHGDGSPWGTEELECLLASLSYNLRLGWQDTGRAARRPEARPSRSEEWVG